MVLHLPLGLGKRIKPALYMTYYEHFLVVKLSSCLSCAMCADDHERETYDVREEKKLHSD